MRCLHELLQLLLCKLHQHGDLLGRPLEVVDAESIHAHAGDPQIQAPFQRVQQLHSSTGESDYILMTISNWHAAHLARDALFCRFCKHCLSHLFA